MVQKQLWPQSLNFLICPTRGGFYKISDSQHHYMLHIRIIQGAFLKKCPGLGAPGDSDLTVLGIFFKLPRDSENPHLQSSLRPTSNVKSRRSMRVYQVTEAKLRYLEQNLVAIVVLRLPPGAADGDARMGEERH